MDRLLIVDDEEDIRRVLSARFAAKGYEVMTAADGDEAIELVSRRRPDAVLVDVHMPSLDGVAVLREIRQARPETLVLLMTGDPATSRSTLPLDEGAYDFIPKPLDMEYLEIVLTMGLLMRRQANRDR